ncbi:MAG TPA: hypothetical protein VIU38_11415 [Anaerolineales bacterium]
MNSVQAVGKRKTSEIESELRRFGALSQRFIAAMLNQLFELSRAGLARRRVRVPFLLLVFAVTAFVAHIFLRFQLAPEAGRPADLNALLPLAVLTGLRIILLIGIAASIGLHFSGRFLADVFEIKDTRTAWEYVDNLVSGKSEPVIHLREGRIMDSDKTSPIIQIGGPGRVIVDYDTAALFEKPDGVPHVVSAMDQNGKGSGESTGVIVEGFERLREPIINLRDQYIGNPSGEPLTVVGRSLDGMPISVTDVRGVFSVRREPSPPENRPSVERPFPVRARDIENLIYNQSVPVLTLGEYPSGVPGDWTGTMQVLIRESLRQFMEQNRLSEFLAGVGSQEAERSEFRADTILSRTLQVSSDVPPMPEPDSGTTPRFLPRTELSNKFKKHGSEFSIRSQDLGMELHWIGVGTWKMPDEATETAISAKHVEAWRMSRENTQRSDPQNLERVAADALIDSKLRLVHEVPIASHERNRARYTDKTILRECLLQDFCEQLSEALDLRYRNAGSAAELEELEQGVLMIEELLRVAQLGQVLSDAKMSRVRKRNGLGRGGEAPPAPVSRGEAAKYQRLLAKLQGDYRVAEAMIANERRRHAELDREQLIARIVERFERYGR